MGSTKSRKHLLINPTILSEQLIVFSVCISMAIFVETAPKSIISIIYFKLLLLIVQILLISLFFSVTEIQKHLH